MQRIGIGVEWGDAIWQLLTPWGLGGFVLGVGIGACRKTRVYGQWWLLPSGVILPIASLVGLMYFGRGEYTSVLIATLWRLLQEQG